MKLLKGSCHCKKVKFQVKSDTFYPYQKCYCSICRKTQGGGGFAINIGADAKTMKVTGKKFISIYRSSKTAERNFCKVCGSALWLFDRTWPELIHPFASAIDTKLPKAPEETHLMLDFKSDWVKTHAAKNDKKFKRYPKESIKEWHERVIGR